MKLFPTFYIHRIFDIDLDQLASQGISLLILDVDNTLTTHNNPNLEKPVRDWLDKAQEKGFERVILSNNGEERVAPFAQKLGLEYVSHAKKPLKGGFLRVFARFGVQPCQTAVIGDQLFTDILGGNRAGACTFLTRPIEPEPMLFFKIKRALERLVLHFDKRRKPTW